MIEVEARGKIEEDFDSLVEKFKKIAKFKGEKKRISFVFLKGDSDIDIKEALDDPVDLRLRVTNGNAEIVIKYGKWGGSDTREEYSIPINLNDFESSANLLRCLGWYKGIIAQTTTYVFDYQGVEFALVKYYDGEFYFEAEKMVENSNDVKVAMTNLKNISSTLGLKIFEEEEFMDYINKLNHSISYKFDFQKQDFSYWKNKFKEYF